MKNKKKILFCTFLRRKFFCKAKEPLCSGSFGLREKVYEEMQDKSVSLKTNCLCNYSITFNKKSLSKDSVG